MLSYFVLYLQNLCSKYHLLIDPRMSNTFYFPSMAGSLKIVSCCLTIHCSFALKGWRDSKDQHDERAANKTTYNAQRRDEKLQAKQDDNSVWRHDRFLEKNDPPAGKKRPAFQEKKIPVNSEHADKAEIETVKSSHVDHSVEGSERREERSRNPRPLDRPEKPSAGDRLPPKRGEAHRDGFLSRERYGGGGGNYRGRDGMNGRQGYGAGGTRAEKWKHDMYNPEDGPPPKNEDDQIAKLEALLAS